MLQAEQHAEYVGLESGGLAVGGLFRNGPRLAFGTGVVDCHVQATKARDGLID
jgi:hypothetical protein